MSVIWRRAALRAEKNDGEALAVMRSTHEIGILDLMHRVKVRELDEANAQIDALNASRNTAAQRYGYYQTLMGVRGAQRRQSEPISRYCLFHPNSPQMPAVGFS